MEFQTAHQYIRDLLPRIRRCPGWDGIPNGNLPAWYLNALSSVALLAQQADVEHVTGNLADDAGEVHLYTKHTVVTLAVAALDTDSPNATVTTYPLTGLASLEVASGELITGGQERGYYWPGEVTAVARYADGRTIILTRREGDMDDLVVFLPALLADLPRKEYAEHWRTLQVHRGNTEDQVDVVLEIRTYPRLGDLPLASIDSEDIQSWVKWLSTAAIALDEGKTKGYAPATVGVTHRIVSGIFKSAVDTNRITSNPCAGTRLPKKTPKRVKPIPTESLWALIDAFPERFRGLILFTACTGLRQGEAFGLTVDRLDFDNKVMHVDRQITDRSRASRRSDRSRPRRAIERCRCRRPRSRP
ncbi:tyrosine-type recombinase/integrase [Promicromonospora sp. NPDC019610]|uniref:tyrosine-type recombinase/integrase n=1 Tax=Promicromonospora sp. NPDC019610 TaxID=3364405 RepID=UPI00378D81FC